MYSWSSDRNRTIVDLLTGRLRLAITSFAVASKFDAKYRPIRLLSRSDTTAGRPLVSTRRLPVLPLTLFSKLTIPTRLLLTAKAIVFGLWPASALATISRLSGVLIACFLRHNTYENQIINHVLLKQENSSYVIL